MSQPDNFVFARGELRLALWPSFEYGPSLNAEELTIEPKLETKKLANFEGMGGTKAQVTLVDEAIVNMTLTNLTHEVIAAALGAESAIRAVETVTDETIVIGTFGLMHPLKRMPVGAITVKASDGSPLVEGKDYILAGHGGLIPIKGGSLLATGETLLASYQAAAVIQFEALVKPNSYYRFRFDGINIYTGKRMLVDGHKVELTPSTFDLSGKDFQRQKVQVALLEDNSIIATAAERAAGLSQLSKYWRIQQEN